MAETITRRDLLASAGLAAAMSAAADPAEADTQAPSEDPKQPVLRDTPHIRAYYARARN